jgi:hypothetical protein
MEKAASNSVLLGDRRTLREFIARRKGHSDQLALKASLDAWFDFPSA